MSKESLQPRRTLLGSSPGTRPLSTFGSSARAFRPAADGNKDGIYRANTVVPPESPSAAIMAFSSNATPSLQAGRAAGPANGVFFERTVHLPEEVQGKHARTSMSPDERSGKGQKGVPPPAIPDELFEALNRDPNEGRIVGGSQSQPSHLPLIPPSSPFSLKGEGIWSGNASSASLALGSDSISAEKRPDKSSLRKRALMESNASARFPSSPLVTPATPVALSPDGQSPGPRNLRKAASAESLRKRAKSNMGLGIGGFGFSSNGDTINSRSASPTRREQQTSQPKDQLSGEIKNIWKSFSAKLGNYKDKGKERETAMSSNDSGVGGSLGRRSMENSRHSLSVYPRHSSERRMSSSSMVSVLPDKTQQALRAQPRSATMVKSQSGPDMVMSGSSAPSAIPLRSIPMNARSQSAMTPLTTPATSRKPSTLDDQDEEAEDEWLARESFTHDLSNRRRKDRNSKPSMARLGRTTPKPTTMEQPEGEEGLSDSEDEHSEIASQLSYVDSADLPLSHHEEEEQYAVRPVPGQSEGVERRGTVRRSKTSIGADGSSLSNPSTLERTRKKSNTRYPSAISTAPVSATSSPLPSPSTSAPIDRIASDGPRQAISPISRSSKRESGTADSGTGMLTPTSPTPLALSPTTSIHTARPRSYSESCVTTAADISATVGTSKATGSASGNGNAKETLSYVRSRSGSSGNLLKELAAPRKSSADFVIAVVGPKKVGKSTIILKNLKQTREKSTVLYEDDNGNRVVSYIGNFSVCGMTKTIEILEADMDILKNTTEGLLWPKYLPKLDGAMICYKQGDPRALDDLTMLLQGFWTRGGVALIALATHCQPSDMPNRQANAREGDKAAEICNIHGAGLVHLDGGVDDPNRKAKNSLQWVLRKVLDSRSASESRSPSRTKRTPKTERPGLLTKRSTATLLAEAKDEGAEEDTPAAALSASSAPLTSLKSASSIALTTTSQPESLGSPVSGSSSVPAPHQRFSQLDIYLSRDALVQKFLFAAVTGNDDQHLSIFLIVYRRFARPYDVLDALVQRFYFLTSHLGSDPLLSRFAQMKLCNTLTRWVEHHPGDFSSPATYQVLETFVDKLFASNWVHQYAMELLHLLKTLRTHIDQEAMWALPDRVAAPDTQDLESVLPERRPSLVPSLTSNYSSSTSAANSFLSASNQSGTPITPTISNEMQSQSDVSGGKAIKTTGNRGRSYSDAGTNASSNVGSSLHSAPSLASRELTRRHANLVEASNLVLETPIARLAQQITKLAWDIFAGMNPRDILRYVMAPRDPKNPGAPPIRNEKNPVSRAIGLGNMLADWTATMVMVQNKQKSRIRLFEHLVGLAGALRELDNYDCLMAVLLGLNCQPIHRLDEMENSIPADLLKKFKSLNRLMASSRSFAAYRMAIVNARPEMIPYLGVHLQDVTRLNDGKSDMRDGLVNWTKMKAIGKHCAIVIDCGRLAPFYPHDENLSKLVTKLPIYLSNEDDTLYDLSYSYKPRQNRPKNKSQPSKFKKLFLDAITPNVPQ